MTKEPIQFEKQLSELSVCIGFPCVPNIPWQTACSLVKTVQSCEHNGILCSVEFVGNCPYVTTARSLVLDAFLKSDASLLFWIDNDVVWEPQDFFKLLQLSEKMDIISGIYPLKTEQKQFVVHHPDLKTFEINQYGMIKVLGVGLGFTVMTRAVLERFAKTKPIVGYRGANGVMRDAFRLDTVPEDHKPPMMRGEDMALYADLRELGYDIWMDPTLQLGHVGNYVHRADPVEALRLEHVYRPATKPPSPQESQ
jgi:hypothetical protein